MKKSIGILGIIILFGIVFYGILISRNEKIEKNSSYEHSVIEIKTFMINQEWGYDIFIDDNLYIHQSNIPAIAGDNGFKTEVDAQNVAGLVVSKIRNNILPPTVSVEELQYLGINTN